MSGRVDVAAETYHDVLRNNTIAPVASNTRANTIDLPISRGVHRLDTPVPISLHHNDSYMSARPSMNPQVAMRRTGLRMRAMNALDNHQFHQAHTVNGTDAGAFGRSHTRARMFLQSLPLLSLTDLPKDNQECPICLEQYHTSQDNEDPVRLPCDHVVGKDCLLKWMDSCALNANKRTCPICRAMLLGRAHISLEDQPQGSHGIVNQVPEIRRRRVENQLARPPGAANLLRSHEETERTLERMNRETITQAEILENSPTATGVRPSQVSEIHRPRLESEIARLRGVRNQVRSYEENERTLERMSRETITQADILESSPTATGARPSPVSEIHRPRLESEIARLRGARHQVRSYEEIERTFEQMRRDTAAQVEVLASIRNPTRAWDSLETGDVESRTRANMARALRARALRARQEEREEP